MEIEREIKEDWFKDHVAKYEILNERISVLEWKRPDTIIYGVRYVMDGSRLYISGDLGEAIFNLTWKASPASFEDINLGYFHSKLPAYHDPKYDFDSEQAVEELKETIEEYLEDGWKEKELTPFKKLIPEAYSCTNMKNWEYIITQNYDEITEISPDAWEWIFGIGRDYPSRIRAYLIGLKMANEQLKGDVD